MVLSKEDVRALKKGDRVACVSNDYHSGEIYNVVSNDGRIVYMECILYTGGGEMLYIDLDRELPYEFHSYEKQPSDIRNIDLSRISAYEAYKSDSAMCGEKDDGEEFKVGYNYGRTLAIRCAVKAMSRVKDLFYSNGFDPAEDYDAKFEEYLIEEFKSDDVIKYDINRLKHG